MDNSQGLNLDQRIGLRLTPQQLRIVRLLEMTAPELDDAVTREVEANPALEAEVDEPRASQDADRASGVAADDSWRDDYRGRSFRAGLQQRDEMPVFQDADDRVSLYDELNRQLDERVMPEDVAGAAHFLIGSLDSNGYLRRPLDKLADDMAFSTGVDVSPETMRDAFEQVRSLEPYGIGAVDIRDCLLLQLRHLPKSRERDDAVKILTDYFDAFSKKHIHTMISGLKVGEERVQAAIDLIKTLNPKPGSGLGSGADSTAAPIIPDAIVSRDEDGRLNITLNNNIPELRVSESYSQAMVQMEAKAKERRAARERGDKNKFLISRYYNDAREFIQILQQRQQTLFSVVSAIVKIQKEYFETDDVLKLKPMMIKDVSALTGQDFSVISRCTKNKYLATDTGIFPLRFFFSENKATDEGESTNRELEAVIRRIVDGEDKKHPLSDEKIFEQMQAEGYTVKRRTVAKYRDRLGIPVARLRKEM